MHHRASVQTPVLTDCFGAASPSFPSVSSRHPVDYFPDVPTSEIMSRLATDADPTQFLQCDNHIQSRLSYPLSGPLKPSQIPALLTRFNHRSANERVPFHRTRSEKLTGLLGRC